MSSALTWNGAVTGIGSLPFVDPEEAVEFVAVHAPKLPFWPQLPAKDLSEGTLTQSVDQSWPMLHERADGRPGFEVDEADLDTFKRVLRTAPAMLDVSFAAGFYAFKNAAKAGRFTDAIALKGQLTGPLTLAWFITSGGEPIMARPSVVDALATWTVRRAAWQISMLRSLGLPLVIFIDEPGLALMPGFGAAAWGSGVLREVCAAIRVAGATVGIHCCNSADFTMLADARPDIVSFDATEFGDSFVRSPAGRRFWADGGIVAFGLTPTDEGVLAADDQALLEPWHRCVSATMAADDRASGLAARTIITPACGLGLGAADVALGSFDHASHLAEMIASQPTV